MWINDQVIQPGSRNLKSFVDCTVLGFTPSHDIKYSFARVFKFDLSPVEKKSKDSHDVVDVSTIAATGF